MILVFDLDDTLYEELTFVRSGFVSVCEYLNKEQSLPKRETMGKMLNKLNDGRGRIFDDLLGEYGLFSKKLVKKCVSVYRKHQPSIKLYKDAVDCLEKFRDISKYIITDGNKMVQKNKIKALNLDKMVKHCLITHAFGTKNAKPSPYCFLLICQEEKVNPSDVVYIADNPNKDFVGIKPLGFKTVRILRGNYRNVQLNSRFEADDMIESLDELKIHSMN